MWIVYIERNIITCFLLSSNVAAWPLHLQTCSHLDKMLAESPEYKLFVDQKGRHSLGGNTIFPSNLPHKLYALLILLTAVLVTTITCLHDLTI